MDPRLAPVVGQHLPVGQVDVQGEQAVLVAVMCSKSEVIRVKCLRVLAPEPGPCSALHSLHFAVAVLVRLKLP